MKKLLVCFALLVIASCTLFSCEHKHEYEKTSDVPPTCTEKGYTLYTCGRHKYEEIPILPHTHSYSPNWSSDEAYHWYPCTSCDDVKAKEEHVWDAGVVTLPLTKQKTEVLFTTVPPLYFVIHR